MGYTYGQRWTDEKIKECVFEVMQFYGIDRMPSASEIRDCFGNSGLAVAIGKKGGFYHWATKLGLDVKESETALAKSMETEVQKIIKEKGFDCETTYTRFPYDLLVNGCVKIDVKAANVSKVKGSDVYSFRLAKDKPTCDIYVAVCLNDKKEPQKFYVIPAHIMSGKKQLAMGCEHSIYNDYLERWDIIGKFAEAFAKID